MPSKNIYISKELEVDMKKFEAEHQGLQDIPCSLIFSEAIKEYIKEHTIIDLGEI